MPAFAFFDTNLHGFYLGLFLIALGSGGIKPLVSTFVGDQFDKSNRSLAQKVFEAFYWIINSGQLLRVAVHAPHPQAVRRRCRLRHPGPAHVHATVIWSARHRYVHVKPVAHEDPNGFLKVVRTALSLGGAGRAVALTGVALAGVVLAFWNDLGVVAALCTALVLVIGFGGAGTWMALDRAKPKHSAEAVAAVRAVLRLLVIFGLVTPFWSLFDQKASTWVLQADQMAKPAWFESSMMQALNPALVLILIPFNRLVLYPLLEKSGLRMTALRRMGAGIALAGAAWIVVGLMQLWLDGGDKVGIVWQVLPYALLTLGEVLVSTTGLEFAYSQAPLAMKGVIMSFWSLSVTVGNLWVLLSNVSVKSESVTARIAGTGLSVTAFQMFFFAGFALLAALAFALYARRYQVLDYYRG